MSTAIELTRALENGSLHKVRLTRIEESRKNVVYTGSDTLYVQRLTRDRVMCVTTTDHDWAEATEDDAYLTPTGKLGFIVEDYLLEILD